MKKNEKHVFKTSVNIQRCGLCRGSHRITSHISFVRWHLLGVLTELWDLAPCTRFKAYLKPFTSGVTGVTVSFVIAICWFYCSLNMMDKTGSALPRTATHCHALPRTATHLFACLECLAWLAILSGLISDPFSAHLHPAGSTPTSCVGSSIRGCTSLNSIFSPCSFTVQRCSKYSTSSQMLFGCDMAFLGFSGRLPFSCVLGWRMKGARMVEDRWAEWQPLN